VRRYVTELVAALGRRHPDLEIIFVEGGPSLPSNLGWALTGLPLGARRAQCDVFHAPAYTAPLWGARPLVVTLHDVSYARHPEWYPYRRDPLRRLFYRLSARRADRVITDSRFSKGEIVNAYGIHPDRIDVVPLGVAPAFATAPALPRELFVLHVGDLHPRRNLPLLLRAVIDMRRSHRHPSLAALSLTLVGRDLGVLETLRAQALHAGMPEALRHVESIDDAELSLLYRRAGVFAYPSKYEGFGLPVLEAMASGAPVVCTSAGAVPEVAAGAAMVVSPDDDHGWRDAIEAILIDPARASDFSERGRRRAAAFTWDATADMTLATYRKLAMPQ